MLSARTLRTMLINRMLMTPNAPEWWSTHQVNDLMREWDVPGKQRGNVILQLVLRGRLERRRLEGNAFYEYRLTQGESP